MNAKIIVAAVVIIVGIVLGAVNFLESNVEYTDFATAERTHKKVQVKGEWVKEQDSNFDSQKVKFSFHMKDDSNRIVKVVLNGAKPNNFELATSVVAKGKFVDGEFHATEVLTKCPSKYEGTSETMKKTL
ncbi:MAG: cytochrome c maturation protein CcmE [Ignavibacteriales bacterium]|nr:cytochrome c maturation protein CcmE [Ignavibacteriales bacterium]MBI3786771.1 cytochrome c maturation protein CcmE [Ignavibacteriales bacterium]